MNNSRNDADSLSDFTFQSVDGGSIVEPANPDFPQTPSDSGLARRAVIVAIAAVIAYAAFDLLLPLVPYRPHTFHLPLTAYTRLLFYSRIAAFWIAPTALFMLLQLWLAKSLVALRWTSQQSLAAAASGVAVWAATLFLGDSVHHFTRGDAAVYALLSPLVFSLALTVGLTAFGVLLSRIVRERNVLLPVALVAMPIDAIGAMTSVGFTNNVVKHAPDVVSHVSVHVPHVGGLPVVALIGPGDALFIAFFLAAVQRLGMNLRGTFWWLFALLTLAISEVIIVGFPIGALVPMGIAVIGANWRYFSLKRAEVFAVIYAVLVITVIVGAFFLVTARQFAK